VNKLKLLNTSVNNIKMYEVLNTIDMYIASYQKAYIVHVNIDVIMKIESDKILSQIVNSADLVLVDGKPLIWISKIHKRPVVEKISGSDLIPQLCELSARKGYSIFILGGTDEIARKARKNLERDLPNIKIVGTYSPSIGFEKDKLEIEKINQYISDAHPDVLIVCFGCPKQEKFVYENYNIYDARVSVCAGATVDFLAGSKKRAPKWMSDCGLEWFYRFVQEPRRLFKRYFIDDIKITKLIWKYRNIL